MTIRCDYCGRPALLVTGAAIYRRRPDLLHLRFWQCPPCDAYVGCHKAGAWTVTAKGERVTSDGTLPLGRLANGELRAAKQAAHAAFDPLWMSERMTRREAYAWLAGVLGVSVDNCHIGMFDVDGCHAVVAAVAQLKAAA